MRLQWAVVPIVLFVITRPYVHAQAEAQATIRAGPFTRQITLFDRQGNVVRTLGQPAYYAQPALSPDGMRLAVVKHDPGPPRRQHIWVFDISTGASTQITFDPAGESAPVWSPDGKQVAFSSRRNDRVGLYRKASDGSGNEELIYRHTLAAQAILTDWSPDGRFLSFHSGGVLFVLPLGGHREAVELIREDYEAYAARFSSDSRFIAYVSDESGSNEVYVRAFDPSALRFAAAAGKWRVSDPGPPVSPHDGNTVASSCYEESICVEPIHWQRDDAELLYVDATGGVMAAETTMTPSFTAKTPKLLFRAPGTGRATAADYYSSASIGRDGRRVVFPVVMTPHREVVEVDPHVLATYTGTYLPPANNPALIVTLEGNQLMAQRGSLKLPLSPDSDGYFFAREFRPGRADFAIADRDFEFIKDAKGVVKHVLVYFGGPGVQWTRQ